MSISLPCLLGPQEKWRKERRQIKLKLIYVGLFIEMKGLRGEWNL